MGPPVSGEYREPDRKSGPPPTGTPSRRLVAARPGKIAGASLSQLAVALGTLIDNMVLLRKAAKGLGLAEAMRLTPHRRNGILSG
jgi:hypothetical protein